MWWLFMGLVVVGLWLYFKPTWAIKPEQVQGEVEKSLRLAADKTGQMYAGLGGKLKLRRDKSQLVSQFKRWAANTTLDDAAANADLASAAAEMTAWLGTLSDDELQKFCDKIARFTAALGFDLAWLWDDKLRGQAELKRALEQAVALYSITAWRAGHVQDQVRAFVAWERWQTQPNKHRALGVKLYSALVQQGMIMMDPALYIAPEKARHAQMVRSIKEVAQHEPDTVSAIVRDLVNPRAAVETTLSAEAAAPAKRRKGRQNEEVVEPA